MHGGTRRRFAALTAVAAATLIVTGCQSAVEAEQGGGETVEGGTLTVVQEKGVTPLTLFAQNGPQFTFNRLVFNFLTQYDESLEPQPELATEWDVSEEGKTVELTLREGVTFHDGRAFTADDVIASIETVQREDVPSQTKAIAQLITDMETDGDHALTLTFSEAPSNMFDLFEMMPIIDVNTVDQLLEGREFNGTGPFSVEKYTPNQGYDLVRNDEYWVDEAPVLDGVNIDIVPDQQSMLSALRAGDADLAYGLSALDSASLQENAGFEILEAPGNDAGWYVGHTVTTPLLSDKKVRQAISYALDRERILKQVLGGFGEVTSLPWSPSSPAFDEERGATYTHEPDRASQMLEEAGAAGETVNVYYESTSGPASAAAEIVLYDLEQAGLVPEAKPLQGAEFHEGLRSGGFEGLFVAAHGFGQLHPATLPRGAFPFNAESNASGFESEEYRALAEKVFLTSDEEELEAAYDELNRFFLDQQFVTDLVSSSYTFAMTSELEGVEATMLDYLVLDEAHFTE